MERREDAQGGEREIKYPTGEAGWKVLDEKWRREEERRIERETLTLIPRQR